MDKYILNTTTYISVKIAHKGILFANKEMIMIFIPLTAEQIISFRSIRFTWLRLFRYISTYHCYIILAYIFVYFFIIRIIAV